MTSLAQAYSPHPGGMQQHPMAQGHPGMAVPHNPGQGQPGPGMPQQMHMGVSGPGPQVAQGGAMMGGIPPGAGGPSAHALQHLNPSQAQQAQLFQQQQQQQMACKCSHIFFGGELSLLAGPSFVLFWLVTGRMLTSSKFSREQPSITTIAATTDDPTAETTTGCPSSYASTTI